MSRKLILKVVLTTLGASFLSSHAFAEDTASQVPIGIAVGPNQNIEVSFQSMANSQGCTFNGAYVIDSSLDTDSKKQMLAMLLTAKATKSPVRLRLNLCSVDRPKFNSVFMDVNWL